MPRDVPSSDGKKPTEREKFRFIDCSNTKQKNCQNKTSSPKIGEGKMINPNSQTNQTDKREFKGKLNKLKSTNLINESKIDGINLIYMVNTRIS